MSRRLSRWINRYSNGWVALSGLVVFLLFTSLVLPAQSRQAETYAGSAGSPDTSFFYTPDNLYQLAESYGPEGRSAYVTARFTFDLIWPMVYTIFLTTSISWINRRSFGEDSLWQRANLAPVFGMLFDYLENVSTSLVMLRYPGRTPGVDVLASVFTSLKWVFVNGSFVLLLTGVVVGIRRKKMIALDKR